MCPAVIVVVIAVDPLHIGLVIHIFIQHRSFQYLLCFYYSWKGEKAVEKAGKAIFLVFTFQWKEAHQGVCGSVGMGV